MKRYLATLCLVAACSTQPVEAQLATACNTLASGYLTAAGYRAQGKLSPDAVTTLIQLEPAALAACNKNSPPPDLQAALTTVTAAVQKIALVNAGVQGGK